MVAGGAAQIFCLQQMGAKSTAAQATVQNMQQASWGGPSQGGCWCCPAEHLCCLLPPCLLSTHHHPHPAPTQAHKACLPMLPLCQPACLPACPAARPPARPPATPEPADGQHVLR